METTRNFWDTLEVYCAVTGMHYEDDYLRFMKGKGHAPLCLEAYQKLAEVIDIQMNMDFNKERTTDTE